MPEILLSKRLWVSLLEATLIVFFSQIPVLTKLIFELISFSNDELSNISFINFIMSSYKLSDVFIFSTGIVGSAMAFFLIELELLRRKPILVVYCVALPLILLFFTTPLFVSVGIDESPPNQFSQGYAILMLILITLNWLFIIFEKNVKFSNFGNSDIDFQNQMNSELNRAIKESR